MKRFQIYCLILFFIGTINNLWGQSNDFGIRFGAELSKKLTKKIELQFEEEIRFNQNVQAFDRSLMTLGGSYSLNKTFKAGLFYTWIYANNQDDGYYESRHRFGGWIQAARKVNRFKITLREKFQNTYRDEDLGNYKYNPKMYLRSKLEVSYNIKKLPLNPYLSAEMHYQLNNPYGNDIDKWRYTAGIEYDINKKFAVDMFFRLDKEINVKTPVNTSVIGTMLKYRF
jgi:hypothetical protein